MNTFSSITHKPQEFTQPFAAKESNSSISMAHPNKHLLADLHERFEGKKESYNNLEEKAKKRKEM